MRTRAPHGNPSAPPRGGLRHDPDGVDMRWTQTDHALYDPSQLISPPGPDHASVDDARQAGADAPPADAADTRNGQGKPWLAYVLVAVLTALAVPLGVLATVILVTSPANLLRDQLVAGVKARTGRDLRIGGPINFSAAPYPGVTLSTVTLSAPPGMNAPPTIAARQLHLTIAIWPLLEGRIVVRRIRIDHPVIDLHVSPQGRKSWAMRAGDVIRSRPMRADFPDRASFQRLVFHGAAAGDRRVMPVEDVISRRGRSPMDASAFAIKRIDLSNGTLRYTDARTNRQETISDLDLAVRGERLDAPLRVTGKLHWNGAALALKARLDTPARLIRREMVNAAVSLNGRPLNATYVGEIHWQDAPRTEGTVRFTAPSIARLAGWLGARGANGSTTAALVAHGRLTAGDGSLRLRDADIVVGDTRLAGNITVRQGKVRPAIGADLKIASLDVDRLLTGLSARPGGERAFGRSDDSEAQPSGDPSAPPRSIDDLLRGRQPPNVGRFSPARKPQVRGYAARDGWSTTPIDLSILNRFDLGGRISIEQLKARELNLTQAKIRVRVLDGAARVELDRIAIHKGHGTGQFATQATADGVQIATKLALENVEIGDVLRDLGERPAVVGRGNITLTASGNGSSSYDIVSRLTGRMTIGLADGALIGWDAGAILNQLRAGSLPKIRVIASEKTPFETATATFNIARGIARTDDLKIAARAVSITGTGSIDIPKRTLDLLLKPKIPETDQTRSESRGLEGIEIPVRVKGAWGSPDIYPDAINGLRNPERLKQAYRGIKQHLKGRDPKAVLEGILRDGSKSDDYQAAKELLKDLFR